MIIWLNKHGLGWDSDKVTIGTVSAHVTQNTLISKSWQAPYVSQKYFSMKNLLSFVKWVTFLKSWITVTNNIIIQVQWLHRKKHCCFMFTRQLYIQLTNEDNLNDSRSNSRSSEWEACSFFLYIVSEFFQHMYKRCHKAHPVLFYHLPAPFFFFFLNP